MEKSPCDNLYGRVWQLTVARLAQTTGVLHLKSIRPRGSIVELDFEDGVKVCSIFLLRNNNSFPIVCKTCQETCFQKCLSLSLVLPVDLIKENGICKGDQANRCILFVLRT